MYKLSDFDHLRDEKMIVFKNEQVDGVDLVIVSYMVASPELWEKRLAIECRGITFLVDTGECVSLPFHKFFNVGENQYTQPDNLQWDKLTTVMTKRDGSMITPALINGKVYLKTKKSFYSDVAKSAMQNMTKGVYNISKKLLSAGYTPIFEYTDPQHEIVINYGQEPQFTLLAIRCHDGYYLPQDAVTNAGYDYDIPTIETHDLSYAQIKDQIDTVKDFEGYVLRFDSYGMTTLVKQKFTDYLLKHRAKTELRERDVVEMFLDEILDDIKSTITMAGMSLEPVEQIEQSVAHHLGRIRADVDELLMNANQLVDRKSVALAYKDHPYFGLLMKAYSGGEPDYKGFYKREHLKDWSLRTIYSNFAE